MEIIMQYKRNTHIGVYIPDPKFQLFLELGHTYKYIKYYMYTIILVLHFYCGLHWRNYVESSCGNLAFNYFVLGNCWICGLFL